MTSINQHNAADVLKSLSHQDFLSFGVQNVAYVKPVMIDGEVSYAIHAADGTPLSVMESKEEAYSMIRQNDLDAVVVH